MFYGSWRHLQSISGYFLVLMIFIGMPSHIPDETFGI